MSEITHEQLENLRRLHEAATPGEWAASKPQVYWYIKSGDNFVMEPRPYGMRYEQDVALSVAMRNALPSLLLLAARGLRAGELEEENARLRGHGNETTQAYLDIIGTLEAKIAALRQQVEANARAAEEPLRWFVVFDRHGDPVSAFKYCTDCDTYVGKHVLRDFDVCDVTITKLEGTERTTDDA